MRRECPKCGSPDVLTERRPNGNSECQECGFKAPTGDFDMVELKDNEGPQPGPAPAPMSVNGRVIVETYKEDRGLKATVSNGFAMVQQKVQVVGLKVLADARIGEDYVRKGDIAYIKEGSLQSAPWAKASFTSDAIEGQFMIVESAYIEFVVRK